MINLIPRALTLSFVLAVGGCATLQDPHRDHLASSDTPLQECAAWFEQLDSAVELAGVGDYATRRIAGYPYLRIDRFLASMKHAAKDNLQIRQAWLGQMRARDAQGRHVEISNLPSAIVADLGVGNREDILLHTRSCSERLMAADLFDKPSGDPALDRLYRQAYVADDYSTAKRGFGLYELTRLPFYSGVTGWQDEVTQTFERARAGDQPVGPVLRYSPPDKPVYNRQQVAELIDDPEYPLGLPALTAEQLDRLFSTYAPVFDIETSADFDRIGRLYWSSAQAPQVEVSQPVVYRSLGFTRVDGRTLLQLEYLVWMPERPVESSTDVLGGHLDGIVWRVTLAPDGEPLLFDSIHPCGCYHMFFPTPRLEPVPAPQKGMEWAFIPTTLPAIAESERLVVELQTGTHYLRNVFPARVTGGVTYEFADYDELRRLPLPQGGSRSIFQPDGLIAGTERGERYLFWPMGIASPGAMRQSGSQATAFVGKRHFDDADIVDRRFRLRY